MLKEIFIVTNRITLKAVKSDCSGAAVPSHPFSEICLENNGGRVLLFVKLPSDYLE